jgi:hypothetical protein
MAATHTERLSSLDAQLRELHKGAAAVDAVINERRGRASVLGNEVSVAKHRLSLQPNVQTFFVELQRLVHERGVGLYEKLLTALVQDVLPENPHPVCLELSTDKGLPALTIQLGRDDTAQNIYEDTGGSLTNVVSAGLRFVALARAPLRKFMVLDEPDCWIEAHRIPRFADILASMATEIKIQAILISHHDDSSFVSIPDRMRLEKNSAGLIQVRASKVAQWESDAQPGIRSIRLERFMSHRDTLLELGPGINVLSGPNHIGKSAIVNALRVFAYHTGADRQIMHGCDDFIITLTLENSIVLTCRRVRKGGRKTIYTISGPGMQTREDPAPKVGTPDFVTSALNIQQLNDLDIQLSHQKMPVFLLHESKTKQATLLSAGLEADYVRQMLETYRKWNDADRATVRNGEKELTQLVASLTAWDALFSGGGVAGKGHALDKCVTITMENVKSAKQMLDTYSRMERGARILKAEVSVPEPTIPVLMPIDAMRDIAKRWSRSIYMIAASVPEATPVLPDLVPIDAMMRDGRLWKKSMARVLSCKEALTTIMSAESPLLLANIELNSAEMETRLNEWTKHTQTVDALAQRLADTEITWRQACEDEKKILLATGNACPLCEQNWPHAEHSTRNLPWLEKETL